LISGINFELLYLGKTWKSIPS